MHHGIGRASSKSKGVLDSVAEEKEDGSTILGFKVGDGRFSEGIVVGASRDNVGPLRVRKGRWPGLGGRPGGDPGLFDLCYSYEQIGRQGGFFGSGLGFSGCHKLVVKSRVVLRCDGTSKTSGFLVKQAGCSDGGAVFVAKGEEVPWHWADARRPLLLVFRPLLLAPGGETATVREMARNQDEGAGGGMFAWSGGLDIGKVGMASIRIRKMAGASVADASGKDDAQREAWATLQTIRANCEVMPNTGGVGMVVNLKEESAALISIENDCVFPVYIAQEVGHLAGMAGADIASAGGDLYLPGTTKSFGWDSPIFVGDEENSILKVSASLPCSGTLTLLTLALSQGWAGWPRHGDRRRHHPLPRAQGGQHGATFATQAQFGRERAGFLRPVAELRAHLHVRVLGRTREDRADQNDPGQRVGGFGSGHPLPPPDRRGHRRGAGGEAPLDRAF